MIENLANLASALDRRHVLQPASPRRDAGDALLLHRRLRIHAYIDENLSDPALSARAAARALGMSVRSLHLALAPSGDSFSLILQRRRLDACLAWLRRPDRGETIAGIAFACGFNSLSSFYRAFQRCYKTCPRGMD